MLTSLYEIKSIIKHKSEVQPRDTCSPQYYRSPGDSTGGKGSMNNAGKHRAVSQEIAMASCSARIPVISSACFLFQTTASSGLQKHSWAFIYHFLSQKSSVFQRPLTARPEGPEQLLQTQRAACIVLRDMHPSHTPPSQSRSKQLKAL